MQNEPTHTESITDLIIALILALVPWFEAIHAETLASGQKPSRTVRELARMARLFRSIAPRYGIPESAFADAAEAYAQGNGATPAPARRHPAPARHPRHIGACHPGVRHALARHATTRHAPTRRAAARHPSARPQPRATRITPNPTRTLEL